MTPALCLVHPASTDAFQVVRVAARRRTHAEIAEVAARQAIAAWRAPGTRRRQAGGEPRPGSTPASR